MQVLKNNLTASEKYELLLHLGIGLTSEDTDDAINTYREALSIEIPERASLGARLNLAGLLMNKGDIDEAIKITKIATQKFPEVFMAWYNLGIMKRKKGDLFGAIDAYKKAKELNPIHPETHQNYAIAKFLTGDIQNARKSFLEAINLLKSQNRKAEAESLKIELKGMIKLPEE